MNDQDLEQRNREHFDAELATRNEQAESGRRRQNAEHHFRLLCSERSEAEAARLTLDAHGEHTPEHIKGKAQ